MDEPEQPEIPSIVWREARGVLVLSGCAALLVIVASFVALAPPEPPTAASASGVAAAVQVSTHPVPHGKVPPG